MSVRLGVIRQGSPYEVEVTAKSDNQGATFVFVGWQPAPGVKEESYPMRLSPGQTGRHALTCPPDALYYLIEVRVNVPEPGGADLKFTGLAGNKPVSTITVTADETYWVEILP